MASAARGDLVLGETLHFAATLLNGWSEATGYIVGYTGKGGGEGGLGRAYNVKDLLTKHGGEPGSTHSFDWRT